MGPPINQLLEEAIDRSTELTGRAQAAKAEAAEVLEGAMALTSLASREVKTLHKEMTDALEAVGHARERVDIEADRASGVLHDLPGRAEATEAAVSELLAVVREDVSHLSDLRARLVSDVDRSIELADVEFQDLAGRVRDLEDRLNSRLTAAETEVSQLRGAVAEGRTQVGEAAHRVREAIESLAVLGGDKARELGNSMNAILVIIGEQVVKLCNHALSAHNTSLLLVRSKLTDELPLVHDPEDTWVKQTLQPIRDALAEFVSLREPAEASLDAGATLIFQNADKSLSALDAVARTLEHVPKVTSMAEGA